MKRKPTSAGNRILRQIVAERAAREKGKAVRIGIGPWLFHEVARRGLDELERREAAGQEGGSKGGRPATKRARADTWLQQHAAEVRRRSRTQTRGGLATWVLAMMPARGRPSRAVVLRALADFLKG